MLDSSTEKATSAAEKSVALRDWDRVATTLMRSYLYTD
jgi:hypothetical protein